MTPDFLHRAREFYLGEMKDHLVYRSLAGTVRDPGLRAQLERIAGMELRHAGFWRRILEQRGEPVPTARIPRLYLQMLGLLQRLLGPLLLISALELGEAAAYECYYRLLEQGELEQGDRDTLRGIIVDELEHEAVFRRQREGSGLANVRDFVLGMNDGLVEILGVVTGLSAVYAGDPLVVAVSALVVGLAGALSMAIGAFISVRSQREVNRALRRRTEILYSVAPQRAREELRERLSDSGMPAQMSTLVAERLGQSPAALIRLLVGREEPTGEWRAALFTGAAYLFGVIFPVSPYFLAERAPLALIGSLLLAGGMLALVGGLIAAVSGIDLRRKVLEMVAAGLGAAGLAWLFGFLVQGISGVSV